MRQPFPPHDAPVRARLSPLFAQEGHPAPRVLEAVKGEPRRLRAGLTDKVRP
jgi:hypothetical protein